jgi:TPR repeat protein
MGFFDFLKSEITSIGKNDSFSKGELATLLKKNNGKDLLEEGAKNGNLECQQLLYTIHMIGAKVDKFNRDKFEYYTKLAANQNDATAQFNLAKIIYDSIEELKPEAMEKNGGVSMDSILSIQQKLEEVVFWYKKSYQNGNKEGLKNANDIEVHLLKEWINPLVDEHYE